jgi:peptidoglycan hydrolase-like protein with peptidoglycan-binding domain
MGDGSAIGGWILAAAIITVLAGGANAAGGSAAPRGSASSGGSGSSARPTTSAARTSGSTGSSTTSSSTTGRGTTRAAVPCTRISTVRSTDGKRYRQLPVSAAGSYLCGLEPGDSGRPVMVLQQALAKCSNRTVKVDGIYGVGTRATVRGEQARQLVPARDGVYDPRTARGMRWPWFTSSTNTFTGQCGPA